MKLKKLNWPKEGYRILCMNCQFSTRYNRTCPHKLKEKSLNHYVPH